MFHGASGDFADPDARTHVFNEAQGTSLGGPPNQRLTGHLCPGRRGAGLHHRGGQIYASGGVPSIAVALNSGLFWPRRTFMRYPGTLVVEFLDPLSPGFSCKDFIARIRTEIEDATGRLVEAARQEQAQLFGRVPGSAAAKA